MTVPPVTDEVQPAAPTHRFLPGVEHSGASSAVRGLLRTVCPPHCQWCTTGSVPQTFVELFILRHNNCWCSYSRSSPSSPCAPVSSTRERLLLTVRGLLRTLSLLTCRVPGCICDHIRHSLLNLQTVHGLPPALSPPHCPWSRLGRPFTYGDHHRSSPPAGVNIAEYLLFRTVSPPHCP